MHVREKKVWWTLRVALLLMCFSTLAAFIVSIFWSTVAIGYRTQGNDYELRYLSFARGAVGYQWIVVRGTEAEPASLAHAGLYVHAFDVRFNRIDLPLLHSIKQVVALPESDRGNPWRNLTLPSGYMPNADGVLLALPLWPVALLSLVVTPLLTRRLACDAAAWRRGDHGCCSACGYDLRSTPERCPECGRAPFRLSTPVAVSAFRYVRTAWRNESCRRRRLRWSALTAVILAMGSAVLGLRALAYAMAIRLFDAPPSVERPGPFWFLVWLAIGAALFVVAHRLKVASRSRP